MTEEFITPRQCRAARALLGWKQPDLCRHSDVGVTTIADFERGARKPFPNNVRAIRRVFEEHGLVFVDGGVVFAFGALPDEAAPVTLRKGVPRKTIGDMLDRMEDDPILEDTEE